MCIALYLLILLVYCGWMILSWLEENIQPNSPGDMDRVLFYHIRPMVNYLKLQGWLIAWHFLRESENWRGRGRRPPLVLHIRFRVKAADSNLSRVRSYITQVLNGLQQNGWIADHYHGSHGTPNQNYTDERGHFDEVAQRPQGWDAAQKWFEAGSEIELVFLKNRFQGTQLGPRFILPDLLHFFGNQCNRTHDLTRNGRFVIFQI